MSIVGVAGSAVLLVGLPLAVAVDHLYFSQEVLRLERAASEARTAFDVPKLGPNDPIELPRGGATKLAVYDASARRIAGVGPMVGDGPVRQALEGSVREARSHGTIAVAVPINADERVAGVVRAEKPASFVVDPNAPHVAGDGVHRRGCTPRRAPARSIPSAAAHASRQLAGARGRSSRRR